MKFYHEVCVKTRYIYSTELMKNVLYAGGVYCQAQSTRLGPVSRSQAHLLVGNRSLLIHLDESPFSSGEARNVARALIQVSDWEFLHITEIANGGFTRGYAVNANVTKYRVHLRGPVTLRQTYTYITFTCCAHACICACISNAEELRR